MKYLTFITSTGKQIIFCAESSLGGTTWSVETEEKGKPVKTPLKPGTGWNLLATSYDNPFYQVYLGDDGRLFRRTYRYDLSDNAHKWEYEFFDLTKKIEKGVMHQWVSFDPPHGFAPKVVKIEDAPTFEEDLQKWRQQIHLTFITSTGEQIKFSAESSFRATTWFVEKEEHGKKLKIPLKPGMSWNLLMAQHDKAFYQVYVGDDGWLYRRTYSYDLNFAHEGRPYATNTWEYEFYDPTKKEQKGVTQVWNTYVPPSGLVPKVGKPEDGSTFEKLGQQWHQQINSLPKQPRTPGSNLIFLTPDGKRHKVSPEEKRFYQLDAMSAAMRHTVFNAVKFGDEAGWWQLFTDQHNNVFRRTFKYTDAKRENLTWIYQQLDAKRSLWVETKDPSVAVKGIDTRLESWQNTLTILSELEAQAAFDLLGKKKSSGASNTLCC